MTQTVVDIDTISSQIIVDRLNSAMAPYFRLAKDASDSANADTFKLEMHSPDGNFRMAFATNTNALDMEAPRA